LPPDPVGVAINKADQVFVTDTYGQQIIILASGLKPAVLIKAGVNGYGCDWLGHPNGIAIDSDGFIYVVDESKNRIHKLKPGPYLAVYVKFWGEYGEGDGQFMYAAYLCIDEEGVLYVMDKYTPRVQMFSLDGKFLGKFEVDIP
jgi:sugar lactone lactonase YvrE